MIDIWRAYFNASMDERAEPIYVMFPTDDPDHARVMCGLLMKHMYGTRAAADGFVQGVASPCIFVLPTRGIACSVHGDDFTSTGE